jgi:hypothetical protein
VRTGGRGERGTHNCEDFFFSILSLYLTFF